MLPLLQIPPYIALCHGWTWKKGLHQLTISQGNCQPVSLNPGLHGLTISQGNRKRVSEKNPEWQTKKSLDLFWPSIILQPPLPPIEAEVHRKVSKATRATMGTFPGKLKTGLRKKVQNGKHKKSRLVLAMDYPATTSPTH